MHLNNKKNNMYINSIGYYIPGARIENEYFNKLNNLSSEWIFQRTGIKSRSRANKDETINYMCLEAVREASRNLSFNICNVDLIIFASYTPSDTIATPGYYIQKKYNISGAKVFYLSSACSSAINAIEVIKSFFVTGISSKALLVCAERNSSYSDDKDCMCGHLWGDGACAYFFSKENIETKSAKIIDVTSEGLGNIGMGTDGVFLNLQNKEIKMPYGKDVFVHACHYLIENTKNILIKNDFSINQLSYFIGHQANMRILKHVIKELGIPENKLLYNIEELGNTGSASTLLVFAQNYDKFKSGDLICISVFGGGYSAGSCLIRMN